MKLSNRKVVLVFLAASLVFTPLRELAYILIGDHAPVMLVAALKYGLELLPLVGLCLAVVAYYPELKSRGRMPLVVKLAVGLMAWAVLSIGIGQAPTWQALRGLRADFGGLIGFLTVWVIAPSRSERKRLMTLMFYLFGFLAFFGVIEFFFNHQFRVWAHQDLVRHFVGHIPQIRSLTSGPNPLGSLLAIATALSLLLFRGRKRLLAIFLIGLFLGLTQARSAWLATAVLGLGIFFHDAKQGIINKAVLLLAGTILLGSAIGVLQYHESLRMVLLHGESTSEHVDITSASANSITHRRAPDLLIGSGIGTAGPATISTTEETVISENWYIQITQELGLIGLVLYASLMFTVVRAAFKAKELVTAWLGVGLAINALFLHTWSSDFNLNFLFWTLMGLALFTPPLQPNPPRKSPMGQS